MQGGAPGAKSLILHNNLLHLERIFFLHPTPIRAIYIERKAKTKPAIGDRDMAKEAKVNYSEELTAAIVERYTSGEAVETIAESIGKAVRSVRAKLVREGVYVAPEKGVKAKREEGPTKKELLISLSDVWPDAPVDGLVNATKEAISALIAHLEVVDDAPAEDPAE
jgi:hypothetical protein